MDDNRDEPQGSYDLLSLMAFAGGMVLLGSLPCGFVVSLQLRYKLHWEWYWSIWGAGAIAAAMAIVGGAMCVAAEFFLRRRWARQARDASEHAPQPDE